MKQFLSPKWIDGTALRLGHANCVIPPKTAQFDIFDTHTKGLVLRVTSTGKKTWCLSFRDPNPPGKPARFGLGTYPTTSLDAARERAKDNLALVEKGIDPRKVVPEKPLKAMSALIEERLAMEVRGKLRTAHQTELRYKKYLLPKIGSIPVSQFAIAPHYNDCVDPLKLTNKMRQAGVVHCDLMAILNFAVSRGERPHNPLAATVNPDPKNRRRRFLTVEEIVLFWTLLPKAFQKSKAIQRILKLCLILGQRVNEIAGMRVKEIDFEKRQWTIPAERAKTGKDSGEHIVPLTDLAISVIREAMAAHPGKNIIFPNKSGKGHLGSNGIANTVRLSCMVGDWPFPVWKAHDLRRTFATNASLAENGLGGVDGHGEPIGINEAHISRVLNHKTGSSDNGEQTSKTTGIYNTNKYVTEKRRTLERWSAFLVEITTNGPASKLGGNTNKLRLVA